MQTVITYAAILSAVFGVLFGIFKQPRVGLWFIGSALILGIVAIVL